MESLAQSVPDSLSSWIQQYLQLAVQGVRSDEVAQKIALHLQRFTAFFEQSYGHERISVCLRRDIAAWQQSLRSDGLAHATINSHLASLSGFTSWVHSQAPSLFATGDPSRGVGTLGLPSLEPRSLTDDQVRSLKNICDRLDRFHRLKGRQANGSQEPALRATSRPLRDRAIVFLLLSTGLRREELVNLDLDQVSPNSPAALRRARRARINRVQGKGKTQRDVYLSQDARLALADYLQNEREQDVVPGVDTRQPLFLSAHPIPERSSDGRLSPRSVNQILEQIGRWHDAELDDPARHISPLRPHDLRHTFAFQLARITGADAYELERRLGHRSQRYIQRYTNPPEDVAASYIEEF